MALKGDRVVVEVDPTMTCDVAVERGVALMVKTVGSGIVLGDSANAASCYLSPSGKKVAGILMQDVVSIDTTRYKQNFHKDEALKDNRVVLLKKGRLTTNMLTGTPTYGDTAYVSTSGIFTPTVSATGGTAATPKAGIFISSKDESGYATIEFNLPIV